MHELNNNSPPRFSIREEYSTQQKLMDILTLATAPSINASNTIYKRVLYRTESQHIRQYYKFHFSNVHKFIIRFCNDNVFSLKEYRRYACRKLSGIALERELSWKASSLEKLTQNGYFTRLDKDRYQLTNLGIEKLQEINDGVDKRNQKYRKHIKEFKPGKGYARLLDSCVNGLLDFEVIEKRIMKLPSERQDRELKIKRGMIRKLVAAGYIEAIIPNAILPAQSKQYRLTNKGVEYCKGIEASDNQTVPDKKNEFKITKFDIKNIISKSENMMLLFDTINMLPNKASVLKRIQTLINAGLIQRNSNGWILSQSLIERAEVRQNINIEREKYHVKKHSADCLTAEQRKIICDMKDFLNLTGKQILKHIYKGNETLFKSDIRYLLDKGILQKDKVTDTYILSPNGTRLAAGLTGDNNIFNSKIYSRREELRHDILIYSAFKDLEMELEKAGNKILSIKTDRKLRSEDMKKHNRMRTDYPDLQVEYISEKSGEIRVLNIEVDTGYSEKVIRSKISAVPNLVWYTDSQRQQEKVLRIAKNILVKVIKE